MTKAVSLLLPKEQMTKETQSLLKGLGSTFIVYGCLNSAALLLLIRSGQFTPMAAWTILACGIVASFQTAGLSESFIRRVSLPYFTAGKVVGALVVGAFCVALSLELLPLATTPAVTILGIGGFTLGLLVSAIAYKPA